MGGDPRKCWSVVGGPAGKWRRKEASTEGTKEWAGLGAAGLNSTGAPRDPGRDLPQVVHPRGREAGLCPPVPTPALPGGCPRSTNSPCFQQPPLHAIHAPVAREPQAQSDAGLSKQQVAVGADGVSATPGYISVKKQTGNQTLLFIDNP